MFSIASMYLHLLFEYQSKIDTCICAMCKYLHQGVLDAFCKFRQGQAKGIWMYHSSKFEIWLYHEGPTLQSRITQKWLELSLSFFHIMKIWDICGHLQLV